MFYKYCSIADIAKKNILENESQFLARHYFQDLLHSKKQIYNFMESYLDIPKYLDIIVFVFST